jgi:hypothetical protein
MLANFTFFLADEKQLSEIFAEKDFHLSAGKNAFSNLKLKTFCCIVALPLRV